MLEFLLGKPKEQNTIYEFYADFLAQKANLTDLSIEIAANRIADVIAKCGFRITSNSDEARHVEYMLNVRPNPNQNATDFWKTAVYDMLTEEKGCIIVHMNKGIYLSDTFQADNNVINEKTYSSITLKCYDNTMAIKKKFKSSDVPHLRYSNPEMLKLLKNVNQEIDKLFGVAADGFKARLPKIRVNMPGTPTIKNSEGKTVTTNEYAEMIAKKLSASEIKSIVGNAGIDVSVIDMKSSMSPQDINALRDSIFSNTAAAFGIPKNILFGDVVNQSNNEFVTYACEPIAQIINNALCGAWLTEEEYIKGERIFVDMLCVKHIDVIDSAGNLDKLYQNGWSHNDIMKLLKQPTVNEEWADMRRFTKNYAEEGGKGSE